MARCYIREVAAAPCAGAKVNTKKQREGPDEIEMGSEGDVSQSSQYKCVSEVFMWIYGHRASVTH